MSLFSKKSFDSSKCVSLLEVTQKRIGILRKKRSIIAKQSRDDVAKLLERGQDANAAARAEHVFREENVVGAYELLEQHCQLVIKGISAIKSQKECSLELKEAIASLIYAAPRCGDLQELQKVRDIFISRYGAEYVAAILELRPECAVNTQIIQKLSSHPPNSDVRLNLLKEIALEHKIDWNYQRAIAASFNKGEASEKSKISPNVSLASKQGVTDDTPLSIPDGSKSKEPAARLADQTAMPPKASIDKSEPVESIKASQPLDVSQNSSSKPGHKGQASFASKHNSTPLMVHDISPKGRDVMGANIGSSKGSSTRLDKSVHQDGSKGTASLTSGNSATSTLHRAEPRKKEFLDTEHISPADKRNQSSTFMHQDDELNSHASSEANNATSSLQARYGDHLMIPKKVLDGGAPPKVKPASDQEYISERASSALHAGVGHRAFPSREKVSPVQFSAASMSVSPGELGGPTQQTASTPAFYPAKLVAPKPEPQSSATLQDDDVSESLAAKQHVRTHQNFVKVKAAKTDEDSRGLKFQRKQGVVGPAANNMIDAHEESVSVNQFKDYKNVRQQAFKAVNREEVSNSDEDYVRGQMKITHQQRVFGSAEIHERSRVKEGADMIPSYIQARNQLGENLSEHQKYSTIAGPNSRHSIPQSELRSMKAEVDQELADLEIAIASAARAADAAIDMVRTCSIRSRADKKGFQRTSSGCVNSETGFESRKAFHNTLNQQDSFARDELYTHSNAKGNLDHNEPCQEQEPVSLDSEMPRFDDSSDDSTSEELPPYIKSRLPLRNDHVHVGLTKTSNMSTRSSMPPFGVQGQNDLSRDSLHVFAKRNSEKERFRDDDCAESVDSFRPNTSSSCHQQLNSNVFHLQRDVQPSYKTQLQDYEEPESVHAWSARLQSRHNAYTAGEKISSPWHGIGNDRVSDMKLANENVDKGVLRWQGLSAGDVGKKKWTLDNVQPASQPYKQHDAMATQNSGGKFQGVSRRSVRSVGPT